MKSISLSQVLIAILIALCAEARLSSLAAAQDSVASSETIDFARDVAPIFATRCLRCHSKEASEGGYRLDHAAGALGEAESGEKPIAPGKADESRLLEVISGEEPEMPEGGPPLKAEEVELIRRWVEAGATWPADFEISVQPKLWSTEPLTHSLLDQGLSNSATLDRFIDQKLAAEKLKRSPPASPQTLVRRLYLDLTGLPPTPNEVAEFTADPSNENYRLLVDRLLASPHYGERWARHWLDVVRFAESNGFETNVERRSAFHYRDWVIEALNKDLPYNRFLALQIAGDQLGEDRATGFLVGGAWDEVKSPDPILTQTQRQDELADMVNTTGTAFFGLTLGCARCHNHKFDPISQKDYFALAAMFAGVQHGERKLKHEQQHALEAELKQFNEERSRLRVRMLQYEPLVVLGDSVTRRRPAINSRENVDHFAPVLARFVRFSISETNQSEPCLDELEIWATAAPVGATPTSTNDTAAAQPTALHGGELRNVGLAQLGAKATSSGDYPDRSKHRLEQVNDGLVGNDFSWISNEAGKGWIQIELPAEEWVTAIAWGRDRNQVYRDRTATKYRIEVAREPGQWQLVASGDDRLASGETPPQAEQVALPAEFSELQGEIARLDQRIAEINRQISLSLSAYVGNFVSQPAPTKRLERGEVTSPQEEVGPNLPSLLVDLQLPAQASDAERRLAMARWLESSQHPLIARVIANRIWQFHFGQGLAATPSDFGTKGIEPSHPELLDWLAQELIEQNWSLKSLHRMILLSETYRQDNKPRAEGLAVDAGNRWLWRFQPRRLESEAIRDSILSVSGELDLRMGGPGFSAFEPNDNYVRVYLPKEKFGPAEFRRMVYMQKIRMEQDATFGTFDTPDAALVCPVRSRSVTPLQALNLLNSPFVLGRAEALAKRLEQESGPSTEAKISAAYRLLFGREVSAEELAAAGKLVDAHGLQALCRGLLNSNEFLILP
jgi:mono/diheme cytochrome c family protein